MDDFKDKPDEFYKWLYQELDRYEANHPNWMRFTLACMLSDALNGLKAYIADPQEKEISWTNPIATLKYPVEMDFEHLIPLVRTFTAEEMCQDADTAAEFIWLASRRFVFRALCRDAAILKQGGRLSFLYDKNKENTPEEQYKEYQEIEDRAFEFPVSVGYDEDTGKEAIVTVEFKFSALMIDQDEHEAYYPVTVSLSYDFNITEWPDEGRAHFWEMLTKILESEDVYSAILETPEGYYPGPTALASLQPAFGELEPGKRETYEPYIGKPKRLLVWSGIFKKGQEPTVQYELPGLLNESELAKIDKRIYELLDALALKVFHAVLYIIYKQHHGDQAYWDINEILDILDYTRDKRGYHRDENVKRVKERLELLSGLTYRTVFFGYDKAEGYTLDFENKLISLEPDNRVSLYKQEKLLYRRCVVRLDRKLYENMTEQKMFAWFNTEFLKLHPQKHKRAILLYSYYCCQLSMGAPGKARKSQPVNIVKRNIDTVLRETGIRIDQEHGHKQRDLGAFFDAHTELKKRGLIKDFSLSSDMAEIAFHESHPALTYHYQSKKELSE